MAYKHRFLYFLALLLMYPITASGQNGTKLMFAPEITVTEYAQAPIVVCEPMFVNRELALSLLLNSREYDGGQTIRPEDPDSEGMDVWEYKADDATLYISNLGNCEFCTSQAHYVESTIDMLSGAYPDNDLTFATRDDVIAKCIDILKQIGVNAKPYSVSSLDQGTLQHAYDENAQKLDQLKADGWGPYIKEKWTEKDACYFIKLRAYFGDLPITRESFSPVVSSSWTVPGCEVWMVISAQGVEYLGVKGRLYQPVDTMQPQQLLNLSEAKESVEQWYNRLLNTNPPYIDSIRLEYRPNPSSGYTPDQRVEMTPAWVFTERIELKGHVFYREYLTLNAITGKVLQYV